MADKRVSMTLAVSREGDTQAIAETAEQLQQLPGPAQEANAALGTVADALGGMDWSHLENGKEILTSLAEASARFRDSLDIDDKRQALVDMRQAWEDIGDAAEASGSLGKQALKEWKEGLAAIRDQQNDLGGLDNKFELAAEAIEGFSENAKKGLEGTQERATTARAALNQLQQEIEEVRAAGGTIADAQLADLAQLEAAYQRNIQRMGQLKTAQQQVEVQLRQTTAAAGGQTQAIHGLDDILGQISPKWAEMASKGLAVAGAFTAGYEAGGKFRDVANELTGGGLDRWVQGLLKPLTDYAAKVHEGTQAMRDQAPLLAKQRQSFEELGIPLQKFTQDTTANMRAILEAEAAYRKQATALDALPAALTKATAELHTFVDTLQKDNAQLTNVDLAKIVGPKIQELLDQYKRLGKEPPEDFAHLAEALAIVTTEQQKALEKQKKDVEKFLADIGITSKKTRAELLAEVQVIVKALGNLNMREVEFVNPQAVAKAKARVNELIDEFRKAGIQIPAELIKVGDSVGAYVIAAERAHGTITVLSGAQERLKDSTQGLTRTVDETGKVLWTMSDHGGKAAEALGRTGSAAGAASGALAGAGAVAERASTSVGSMATKSEQAGGDAERGLGQAGKAADEAARNYAAAQERVSALSDAIGGQGDAALDTTAQLAGLRKEVEALATAMGAAKAPVSGLGKDLTGLGGPGAAASKALEGILASLNKLAQSGAGFGAPILAELDKIIAKAAETKAALDGVMQEAA
jgi:DNA repair exonuclease SbcCD ATPase subunit